METILYLTLKKKWYDMIASGEKKEEYREIKPYWIKRLHFDIWNTKPFDYIIFSNGYSKDAPKIKIEFLGMKVGIGNPSWGWEKECYVISLGEIIN